MSETHRTEWVQAPTRYLTTAERKHNARIFADYFIALGWTRECIAAMLGNIEVESSINPGLWEDRVIPVDWETTEKSFGLTQWKPARKYIQWALDTARSNWTNGYNQCDRILYEQQNNIQWSTDNILNMTWNQFIVSTESPETLARVFVWAYERPSDPDIDLRQRNARKWYNFINRLPIWILCKIKEANS